jgi:integrase
VEPYLATEFKMKNLTKDSIDHWLNQMTMFGKLKPDTIAMRLRDLRAFINWCVRNHKLDSNPFVGIQIPKGAEVGRKLTAQEIQALYENTEGLFRTYFVLALETGARQGETLKARWEHINLSTGSWHIPAENCKTKITRTVPLSSKAIEALTQATPKPSGFVFEGLTKNSASHYWKETKKRAAIQGRLRLHDLRHTMASNWRGRAASLRDLCGWKTNQMMMRYTHIEHEELKQEVDKTSAEVWGRFGVKSNSLEEKPNSVANPEKLTNT